MVLDLFDWFGQFSRFGQIWRLILTKSVILFQVVRDASGDIEKVCPWIFLVEISLKRFAKYI